MASLLTLGGRFCVRIAVTARTLSRNEGELTRTLIYGAGSAGLALISELRQNESLKCDVIGLINDDPRKANLILHGKRVLGSGRISDLGQGAQDQELLIAIPSATGQQMVRILVIIAIAGLLALVGMASDGPGFLAPHRTIDVVFRDAQGIRIGSTVRVAGLDTGNVVDVDLVEVEGTSARVKISLPAAIVKKLRQDVKVSIQPALTGMSHVNVLSTGRSSVALVAGQSIPGVETWFFDPIIEQVGLGPVERNHLSHTIAEVHQRVDSVGPQIEQMLGSLQETTSNLREMSESIRPAVESTVGHVEDLTAKSSTNHPRSKRSSPMSRASPARPTAISSITARRSSRRSSRCAT